MCRPSASPSPPHPSGYGTYFVKRHTKHRHKMLSVSPPSAVTRMLGLKETCETIYQSASFCLDQNDRLVQCEFGQSGHMHCALAGAYSQLGMDGCRECPWTSHAQSPSFHLCYCPLDLGSKNHSPWPNPAHSWLVIRVLMTQSPPFASYL